jgi:hypothetical protein
LFNALGEWVFASAEDFQCGEQRVFVGGYGVVCERFFRFIIVIGFFVTAKFCFKNINWFIMLCGGQYSPART